ncbi:3-hydroxyacyl-ACP dehydratase [Thaumasiovibrio sp. DFM-14]|uniref:ApeI family dehydratase n=1 Tax=Thaumasiovibrio sp. DFM-14 TaxID=3384792 RepID=UPI0039A0579E
MKNRLPDVVSKTVVTPADTSASLAWQENPHPDITLSLKLGADIVYFDGHFDDFALLPGVVQLDWAIHYGQAHYQTTMQLTEIKQIKFQRPMCPEALVLLRLSWNRAKRELIFKFSDEQWVYSQGRLVV